MVVYLFSCNEKDIAAMRYSFRQMLTATRSVFAKCDFKKRI